MHVKISRYTQLLNEQTAGPISYNQVLLAVLSGQIPGVLQGSRWFVDPATIPAAAEHFAKQRTRDRRSTVIADSAAV